MDRPRRPGRRTSQGKILRGPLNDTRIGDYQLLDWNIVLRSLNRQFDQLHDLAALNDRRLFRARYESMQIAEEDEEAEVSGSRANVLNTSPDAKADEAAEQQKLREFFRRRSDESVTAYSERVSRAFTEMRPNLFYFRVQQARRLEWPMTLTMIALARFHAATGRYPEGAGAKLVPSV